LQNNPFQVRTLETAALPLPKDGSSQDAIWMKKMMRLQRQQRLR